MSSGGSIGGIGACGISDFMLLLSWKEISIVFIKFHVSSRHIFSQGPFDFYQIWLCLSIISLMIFDSIDFF